MKSHIDTELMMEKIKEPVKVVSLDMHNEMFKLLYHMNKEKSGAFKKFKLIFKSKSQKDEDMLGFNTNLSAIDTILLRRLKRAGYLSEIPLVKNTTLKKKIQTYQGGGAHQTHAFTTPERRAVVHIQNDHNGLVSEMGYGNLGKHDKVAARWLILLHEGAHCEFAKTHRPFRPNNTTLDDGQIQAINDMAFSSLSLNSYRLRRKLDEAFADVYGTIMAMDICNHSSGALGELYYLTKARRKQHHSTMDHTDDLVKQGSIRQDPYLYCATALEYLCLNIGRTKYMSVEQKKQEALEIASNTIMLDLINTNKLESLKSGDLCFNRTIFDLSLLYLQDKNDDELMRRHKESFEFDAMNVIWSEVKRSFDKMDGMDKEKMKGALETNDLGYIYNDIGDTVSKFVNEALIKYDAELSKLKEKIQNKRDLIFENIKNNISIVDCGVGSEPIYR